MKKFNKYNIITSVVLKERLWPLNNRSYATTSNDLNTFSNYISGLTQTDGTFFVAFQYIKLIKGKL